MELLIFFWQDNFIFIIFILFSWKRLSCDVGAPTSPDVSQIKSFVPDIFCRNKIMCIFIKSFNRFFQQMQLFVLIRAEELN